MFAETKRRSERSRDSSVGDVGSLRGLPIPAIQGIPCPSTSSGAPVRRSSTMRHLSPWAEPKLSQACRSGVEGSRACRGIVAAPAAMDGSRMTSRSKRLGRCRGWNPRANELVRTTTSPSPHSRFKDRGTDILPLLSFSCPELVCRMPCVSWRKPPRREQPVANQTRLAPEPSILRSGSRSNDLRAMSMTKR